MIGASQWESRKTEWLPDDSDRACVRNLMGGIFEPGMIANWISPPERGVNGKPFDFEYVRFEGPG